MIRTVSRLIKNKFDLLVIGGGINGAAVAHLAAQAGAGVALVEKHDFAAGTSSKSTKLLHGGIRYLENFEFDLVQESLRERFIQHQAVPYLAKPLSFIIPVYKRDPRPLWKMRLGVWLYDVLSGQYRVGRHRVLSVGEVKNLAPGINPEGLTGGVEYFDVQMDDARICLENVLMAEKHGAAVANYLEATDFLKDSRNQAIGVKAIDHLTGENLKIMASKILVTAGPWSDEMIQKDTPQGLKRLRLTKGVHIVYQGQISPSAFLLQSRTDQRIFFVIPFKGNTLIGTTDTDYNGSPDDVKVEEADIQYLLQEAGRVFPNLTFDPNKIITTFAGLRPLVADHGHPSQVSRKHVLETHASGVSYLMGGKYTTYRAMAQETVEAILPQLKPQIPHASSFALYGSGGSNEEVKILSRRYDVTIDLVRYLQGLYGSRFADVLNLTRVVPKLKERICSCSQAIFAQVIYSRDVEMAHTPEDIVQRRLGLTYLDCPQGNCHDTIVKWILQNF